MKNGGEGGRDGGARMPTSGSRAGEEEQDKREADEEEELRLREMAPRAEGILSTWTPILLTKLC